jgi:hypothetical protein
MGFLITRSSKWLSRETDGKPVPGFAVEDMAPLYGVRWKGDPSLAALAGRPVRLRFVLKDADVFAFRFGSET